MRYTIEPRDKMYVKECGFLYFAKDMGKILNNRYCQKNLQQEKDIYFQKKGNKLLMN